MAKHHQVQQGECFVSLAKRYGFTDYRTVYDHPENARLKEKRPNPNILFPGDVVFIPEKQDKQETRGTAQRHQFQVKEPVVLLRVALRDGKGETCANKRYEVKTERKILRGVTDAQGRIEQPIPADCAAAELSVWLQEEDPRAFCRWQLALGHLDPVERTSGVQARLNNLGYDCGPVDGE